MTKKQEQTKKTTQTVKEKSLDNIFDLMGSDYNIPRNEITTVLRQTAFNQDRGAQASTEEMISLLSVAQKYGLNPFTREIYAFRSKKGTIIPVVGFDGWVKIMNSQDTHKGFVLKKSENWVTIGKSKLCPDWIECTIYREDLEHPVIIDEYLDECYNGFAFDKSPWNTHTKRFLRMKAISQCVRVAYGVSGIYTPDEAERIDQAEIQEPPTGENLSENVDEKIEIKPEPEQEPEKPVETVKEPVKEKPAPEPEKKPVPEPEPATESETVNEDQWPEFEL